MKNGVLGKCAKIFQAHGHVAGPEAMHDCPPNCTYLSRNEETHRELRVLVRPCAPYFPLFLTRPSLNFPHLMHYLSPSLATRSLSTPPSQPLSRHLTGCRSPLRGPFTLAFYLSLSLALHLNPLTPLQLSLSPPVTTTLPASPSLSTIKRHFPSSPIKTETLTLISFTF